MEYTCSLMPNANINLLDLNDFPLPIYQQQLQDAEGVPAPALAFLEAIKDLSLIHI